MSNLWSLLFYRIDIVEYHSPYAVIDLVEPDNIDYVEKKARRYQKVPEFAESVPRFRVIDSINLVPVRRDTGDACYEKYGSHSQTVKQEKT